MDHLRRFAKQIPGASSTVRKFRRLLKSRAGYCLERGDWIYERPVIEWLCKSSARKQLPPLYRIFALYCASQHRLGTERIIGGRHFHKTIISLGKLLRLKDHTELNLGPHAVFVDLNDPRMLHVPNEVSENYPDTSILQRFLAAGDTFVDVGANHGSFSIVASKVVGPKGLVVAVEPQSRKADLVKKSLAVNAQCKYQVHSFACGDRTGQVDFYIPAGSSGGASIFSQYAAVVPHRKVSVPMRRFDDAIDWNNFPGQVFVKVDIEGSEMNFLRGAKEMIRARKPRIMLEINPTSMTASGEKKNALLEYLRELGYAHVFEVKPFSGPEPLRELDDGGRRDVRNVIVTARDVLLKTASFISFLTREDLNPFWIFS
jgi:FkbM family methyltransferase